VVKWLKCKFYGDRSRASNTATTDLPSILSGKHITKSLILWFVSEDGKIKRAKCATFCNTGLNLSLFGGSVHTECGCNGNVAYSRLPFTSELPQVFPFHGVIIKGRILISYQSRKQ
jgi:hypothetical protein